MQVFKSYFKILNKKKGSMLMYIGIFAGIIFGFILPNSGKTEDEYKSMKCKSPGLIMTRRQKVKNCFRIWIMHINMLN